MRAAVVDDGYQNRAGPFEPLGSPVWAKRELIRDAERYSASTVGVDAVARFSVRYWHLTASLTHEDRLVCEGRTYAIVGIKEVGRRIGFEITAAQVRS